MISGSKDILQCRSEKFQPFTLPLNMSSSCVLLKSQCGEEGQIVFINGTTTHDRSCRCNYIDNYAFVTKPKATCHCIPSEEDCSCYNKNCPINHYLSPGNYERKFCVSSLTELGTNERNDKIN